MHSARTLLCRLYYVNIDLESLGIKDDEISRCACVRTRSAASGCLQILSVVLFQFVCDLVRAI